MIDYQGFVGGANTGDPFLGILNLPTSTTIQPNDTNVNKVTLAAVRHPARPASRSTRSWTIRRP